MSAKLDSAESRLYQLCWEYARDAIFVADLKTGILVNINPAAEMATGYGRNELIGKHFTILHPQEEHERMRKAVEEAGFPRPPLDGFHLLRKDGRSLPVSISASAPFESKGQTLGVGIYRDTTEVNVREHRLITQNWALSAYAEAVSAIGNAHSSSVLLQAICEAITRDPAYLLAWVGIAEDGPEKSIRIASAAGSAKDYLDDLHLGWAEDHPTGRGPASTCIRTNSLQIVQDYLDSPILPAWLERARHFGIRSSVCIPFSVEDGERGALVIYSDHCGAFPPEAIDVFQHLARQIGIGMHALEIDQRLRAKREQLAKTERELVDALSAMVSPIVSAMELRDPYTSGHQGRVAEIACAIGHQLGWSENRLQGLRVAAQVHDIGKIAVPSEFLTKPTQLSPAEQAMVNAHPETGYTILKDIRSPWPIADTVRQHHERMDGSGYPMGLKGEAILLEARVLAVADAVEAMTSFRPYRPASSLDAALDEVEKKAGKQFDRGVVSTCISLFREKGYTLPGAQFR